MASVYKRTWRGEDGKERVRWVAAYRDQDGRRHNKGFVTRKDAKTFLTLVEGEIVRGIHTPEHASITAAKAVDLWLTRGELERLERSTLRQYRNHVRLHIVPLIGSVKLAKLLSPVIQLFRDKLLETRSRATSRKILASLKSIIGEAMRRRLVAQNCAAPVAIDSKRREAGKLQVSVDIPSLVDVNLLLDHAQRLAAVLCNRRVYRNARVRAARARVGCRRFRQEDDRRPTTRRHLGHDGSAEIGCGRAGDPDGAAGCQRAEGMATGQPEGRAPAGLPQWQRQRREPRQHQRARL